jgi:hypothetical protein
MPEERPIIDEVLDYAFYAPLGLALTIAEDLPGLVARGRRQIEGQFGVARFVGKMAVNQFRHRVDAFLETPERPAAPPESPSASTGTSRLERVPATGEGIGAAPELPTPSPEDLAIEGYDSLAASQVVARLASLGREELDAVRRYEERTRRRQTILNRIAQLEAHDGR